MMGEEQYIREMWEYFRQERLRVKKVSRGTRKKKGKQEYRASGSRIASQRVLGASENVAMILIVRTE